jgi:WD40 repeat protein
MPDCALIHQCLDVDVAKLISERDLQWRNGPLVLEGHSGLVFSVAFSPDGLHIASGSSDTTARV